MLKSPRSQFIQASEDIMNTAIEIFFEDTGKALKTSAGRRFIDICDEFDTPILFGCRSASCGTCLVEVTGGMENLSPVTDEEAILLEVMAEGNPLARLACQCVVNGSISVKTL
jgi:2Fe-2S ferredoxin